MRAFIAIPLPEEAKQRLFEIQETLKAAQADVKWVNPNDIHITLKFMGDLNEKKLALIKEITASVANDHPAFQARIACLGTFPHRESPQVIWMGIDQGDEQIKLLNADLEARIAQCAGIPKEKRSFTSHITIGRVRSGNNREKLSELLKQLEGNPRGGDGDLLIDRIVLCKSTLTPHGPLYEILQEARLPGINTAIT